MPLPSLQQSQTIPPKDDTQPEEPAASVRARDALLIIAGVLLLGLAIQSVRAIRSKKPLAGKRAYLVSAFLMAAALVLIVVLLMKPGGAGESLATPLQSLAGPLGPAPAVLMWVAGMAIIAGAVFIGVRIVVARHRSAPVSLETEVQRAMQALLDGRDLRTVILQCYLRMSQALQQEQNLQRKLSMTTGEFENLLTARGVPAEPVHRLTRLFDAVRYGRWAPAPGDEQQALGCLDAILSYCRRTEQGVH